MGFLSQISWMPFLVLNVVLVAFVLLRMLEKRLNWTLLILLALGFGAGIGIAFQSPGNAWMVWVDLLGTVYVKILKLLVAPVILLSIISGFIRLKGRADAKKVGLRSVLWLMVQAGTAILLSITVAELLGIGRSAGGIFKGIRATLDDIKATLGDIFS